MRARLIAVLALLALAAGAIVLTPRVRECPRAAPLEGLPTILAGWTDADGIPDETLPIDPSEVAAVRRTYRSGPRVAWVSVALFTRQDDPERRASINRIYPEQDVSRVERAALPGASPRPNAVVVSRRDRRVVVAYWYQIAGRTYASETRFRLALMREILLARRGDSLLARVAVPVAPDGIAASLASASELAAALRLALVGG
ncbi:MAG TPA: EpsI family protein, partial [Methylomirabilota bacterium]|nr:EpsI family protein [Methylomirabilota bacterium]